MLSLMTKERLTVFLLIGILAITFIGRILYLVNQSSFSIPAYYPDTYLYDHLARNLISGAGYLGANYHIAQEGKPTAFYGPVYPLFLAAVYRVLGYSFYYVQIIQIILSLVGGYLVFKIGKMLYGQTVGLLSAALYAVYPELVAYPSAVISESVYVFLELLFVYYLAKVFSSESPTVRGLLLAGFAFSLAYLTRQVVSLAPLIILLLLVIRYRDRGFRWLFKRSAAFVLAAAILIAPWAVRNYLAFGQPSPATTTGGVTFWWGNNTNRQGLHLLKSLDIIKEKHPGITEMEFNSLLYKMGIQELSEKSPADLIVLIKDKWTNMWKPSLLAFGKLKFLANIQQLLIYVLLALGISGSVALIRRFPGTVAITIVLLSGIAMNLVTDGISRYNLPYMPLLAVTAFQALFMVCEWVKHKASLKRPLRQLESEISV